MSGAAIAGCFDAGGVGGLRRLGSTIDDAFRGGTFDKIEVALGLDSHPAGAALERLAEGATLTGSPPPLHGRPRGLRLFILQV